MASTTPSPAKWLQGYLNEYAWRYNHRSNTTRSMFEIADRAGSGMSESDAIKGIRKAARQRERAEQTRRERPRDLRERIRQAQAEGESISRIAREAGLSRQGVYDLLAARPS